MPIEIRELIIEGVVVRDEDQTQGSTQVLTEADTRRLKEDIINTLNMEEHLLTSDARRQLMADLLREVKKMTEDRWRR